MHIVETSKEFEISFDYHPSKVAAVKAIDGARFNGGKKFWSVPKYKAKEVEELAKKYGVLGTNNSPQVIGTIEELPNTPQEFVDMLTPHLKRMPYEYQWKGIYAGFNFKRFINGDEPGLGKTGQSIITTLATNAFPVLVVCPSVLKENWRREFELWTNHKAIVLEDKIKHTWPQYLKVGMASAVIVNYESLKKYFVKSINIPKGKSLRLEYIEFHDNINLFKGIIFDEFHKVKDGFSQQARFAMGIAKGKEVVQGLTGTPVKNKPKDLISQLVILNKLNEFGNYKNFIQRYCDGGSGASNLSELNYMLNKHCFFRREKKEVLNDLPDKSRNVIICDIDNYSEYNKANNDFVSYLKEKGFEDAEIRKKLRGEIMVQFQMLKGISARGKMLQVEEHISEVVDAGEKIVVFAHQKVVIDRLLSIFPDAVTVRGGQEASDRQSAVDRFQNDPKVQIIICSINAAGTGLTLTASSRMAFVELPWTPADVEQCESRCHRIGQKNSVEITYFLGKNTIDQHIYKIIEAKREISNSILGATDQTNVIIDDITNNIFNQK